MKYLIIFFSLFLSHQLVFAQTQQECLEKPKVAALAYLKLMALRLGNGDSSLVSEEPMASLKLNSTELITYRAKITARSGMFDSEYLVLVEIEPKSCYVRQASIVDIAP